jgi:predicted nucleic acid-binding Zn ribbon protein/glutaredoxin
MARLRKNINCKVCGNPNPKGKQFCSDGCKRIHSLKLEKLKRDATKHLKPLYNGLSKIDEITYYKDLISRVTSYNELSSLDTMKHKRSKGWIVKYCRPKWVLSAESRMDIVKREKNERDSIKVDMVSKLPYIKKVIKTYYNTENHLRIEFECNNGHILRKGVGEVLKQTQCTLCKSINLRNTKLIQTKLQLNASLKEKKQIKLKKELARLKIISDFIESGEYKNYSNWKETPILSEYVWIRNGRGKRYLTNELEVKIDRINYFIYKTPGASCPYPTKKGHRWCKHCENQKSIDFFRKSNICIECAKVYRREHHYEAEAIQQKINYRTNPVVKLSSLVRVYINSAMKGKPKSHRTKDILGMEWGEFRKYIESMFEPWMNWDNHGHGRGKWALQHIIPKTYAETEDDVYRLNYHKNLMPMDFSDNGALSDRILRYQLNEWHYDNCGDFLEKYKDRILDNMGEIYLKS